MWLGKQVVRIKFRGFCRVPSPICSLAMECELDERRETISSGKLSRKDDKKPEAS